jgi:hypothetical protein
VLKLLDTQIQRTASSPETDIAAVFLVGGFSASNYLYNRVRKEFGSRIRGPVGIVRPGDCDVATLQGAARYGLGVAKGNSMISSVIVPRAYIMSECFFVYQPMTVARFEAFGRTFRGQAASRGNRLHCKARVHI